MAVGAILYCSPSRELPVMIISMTIGAMFVFQLVCQIVLVAGFAGNRLVFTFQQETGL